MVLHVVRSAIGFTIFSVVLLTWATTFIIGGSLSEPSRQCMLPMTGRVHGPGGRLVFSREKKAVVLSLSLRSMPAKR
ncbi:hypothetical protein E2562_028045 [Oryza meyeriana var. granulata]|uniref:Uncharacterized protein n=1 Tax=Oryza meyeriana var. granulata TaxID=110450 RepID=A0A6G1C0D4_9ORYZ|nr:hypothetical protein E2562_028045 [Oryza meyeriana var. granulata]